MRSERPDLAIPIHTPFSAVARVVPIVRQGRVTPEVSRRSTYAQPPYAQGLHAWNDSRGVAPRSPGPGRYLRLARRTRATGALEAAGAARRRRAHFCRTRQRRAADHGCRGVVDAP